MTRAQCVWSEDRLIATKSINLLITMQFIYILPVLHEVNASLFPNGGLYMCFCTNGTLARPLLPPYTGLLPEHHLIPIPGISNPTVTFFCSAYIQFHPP